MTFNDRYDMLKTSVEKFLCDIDERSVINFDVLREGLIRAAQNYIDPKDGDVVCIEWPDGDRTHYTKIGETIKHDSLVYYNNKWYMVLGEDRKRNDWLYQPVHWVDAYARVLKAE